MKTLYIMVGCPGVGKSTWLKNHVCRMSQHIVSRDIIRFNLLSDNDEYFAHEKEVFNQFIEEIQHYLSYDWIEEIYADATHATIKSRMKLLKALNLDKNEVAVIPIIVDVSFRLACRRNSNREGRKRVPDDAMYRMWESYQEPHYGEYPYAGIWKISYKR